MTLTITDKMTALVDELREQVKGEMLEKVKTALGVNGAAPMVKRGALIDHLSSEDPISAKDLAEACGLDRDAVNTELRTLVKAKQVKRIGNRRGTKYLLR